jgi:pimeloyl-ACP methyl ester carboxylesterase
MNQMISCSTSGKGPTVVIIPGLDGFFTHFYKDKIIKTLSKQNTVVCIKYNNKKIIKTDSSSLIPIIEKNIVSIIKKIRPVTLLGISMGSLLAQNIAASNPSLVNGLILVSSFYGGEMSWKMKGQRDAIEKTRKYFDPSKKKKETLIKELLTEHYSKQYLRKNKKTKKISDNYQIMQNMFEAQYNAILEHNSYNKLNNCTIKSLIVHGENDIIFNKNNARILSKLLSNSKIKIFEDAGHSVIDEKWIEVLPIVNEFIQKSNVQDIVVNNLRLERKIDTDIDEKDYFDIKLEASFSIQQMTYEKAEHYLETLKNKYLDNFVSIKLKEYKCPECGKQFNSENGLQTHARMHK